jgi:hypothetical protein
MLHRQGLCFTNLSKYKINFKAGGAGFTAPWHLCFQFCALPVVVIICFFSNARAWHDKLPFREPSRSFCVQPFFITKLAIVIYLAGFFFHLPVLQLIVVIMFSHAAFDRIWG